MRSEANGSIHIFYYKLDNDAPIILEFNPNENWFKLVIPKFEKYDEIRKKLNLGENIDVMLTKTEFHQKLNGIYLNNSYAIRKIIREIKLGFNELKADLDNIHIV